LGTPLVLQDEATPSFSTGHKKKGANYTAPMNFVSGGIVGQDKNKKKNKKKEEDEEVEEVEERGRQGDSSDSDDGGKSLIVFTRGCGAVFMIRYTHKTSSYRTSSYKTSSYQMPNLVNGRLVTGHFVTGRCVVCNWTFCALTLTH
jgi:hypothetical protein